MIDGRSFATIKSVSLERGEGKPMGVAVSPDGGRVYVANGRANTLSVLDATSFDLIATIPVGKRPWGVTVSRDGTRIYTADGMSNAISVIDAALGKVIATITVGDRPWGIALIE